jgi:hypothetical protein
MTIAYKILGQSNPAATSNVDLYTVPANTSVVASTLNICNQAIASGTFRIAVRPAGETLASKHYIAYDNVIPALDTISLTIGMSLAATDVVTVYASSSSLSFNLFGSEIT